MKFYNIKLRLASNMLHEVRRQNVSAAEVLLLNEIHGGSAIVEFDQSGEKAFSPRDHRVERRRLELKFGEKQKYADAINKLFGGVASQLPEDISAEDLAPIEDPIEDLDAPFAEAPAVPKSAMQPEKAETQDVKATLRASIVALGGTPPVGNASVTRLREQLGELQLKAAPVEPQPGDEPVAETPNVLGE